jgi:lysylphosphatidylglycerol synthetase-like protein (DUF2156 family)
MDPNQLLLTIGCAASMPSAALMLHDRQDVRSKVEMVVGASICIVCLGLVLTQSQILSYIAVAALALAALSLAKRQQTRWPLLLMATVALLAYLHRMEMASTTVP